MHMRRMIRAAGSEEGFGLVELAVAMMLLGIILISALPAVMLATEFGHTTRIGAEATRVATTAAEEAAAQGELACTPTETSDAWVPRSPDSTGRSYTMTSLIACDSSIAGAGQVQVLISVDDVPDGSAVLANIITRFVAP